MARPKGPTLGITKEELERLYFEENKTTVEIGSVYGCDRKNIDYYFKKFGIPKKSKSEALRQGHENNRGTKINAEYIAEQVAAGRMVGEIAAELKVSRGTVAKYCREAGYNFQNHEAQREKQSKLMSERNPVPRGARRSAEVVKKRKATISNRLEYSELFFTNADIGFTAYAKKSRTLAYTYYQNNNLYESGKVIDHIFSVKDGYDCGVPIVLISHPSNLRLVTPSENGSKGATSMVSLYEFHSRIGLRR